MKKLDSENSRIVSSLVSIRALESFGLPVCQPPSNTYLYIYTFISTDFDLFTQCLWNDSVGSQVLQVEAWIKSKPPQQSSALSLVPQLGGKLPAIAMCINSPAPLSSCLFAWTMVHHELPK